MKKIFGLAVLALAVAAPAVQAQGNDNGVWLVRARATNLHSANNDGTGFGLSIDNKTFPEIDGTYFFTPDLAAELVLTYPQKQTVHSSVVGADIGTLKHLPPTLLAQYHFTGLTGWRPYLGAGVNYTRFSSVNFFPNVNTPSSYPTIKHDSYGLAVQAGVDFPVANGWLINVDVKKVQIGTDVYVNGVDQGKFKIDPVLFSVGVGLRF